MAAITTTTILSNGLAEDFEDVINNVSPTDTPLYTMAKKKKASAKYHQWQVESLAGATHNAQVEGDDASYGTLAATTTIGNYCQIARKTVGLSGTLEAVKKYGRKSEIAHQLLKAGKELKRDIEVALVRNKGTEDGASGTARVMAGFESYIKGNNIKSNAGQTTPGFSSGSVTAPTDGTATTFLESDLKLALTAAWTDGGDPSVIMMNATNKTRFDSFSGIATKYNQVSGATQADIIGAADVYVSSYGNHKVVLNRHQRSQAVLCIDPDYVSVATLRPISQEKMAKTGDSEKYMMVWEGCLVVDSLDAHAKVSGVGA